MELNIERLSHDDAERLQKHRDWMVGHYEDPSGYESVTGKLRLISTILENGWVETDETWKLHSLGVTFGDALEQEIDSLHWAVVEDEYGRDPALQWRDTTTVVFPLTAIAKRVEDHAEVDVEKIFVGFQKAIAEAVRGAT
ncbi:MAG: DUF3806 domain-containing protein [Pseudomonadota bacterium]